jgi:hypothetical protein
MKAEGRIKETPACLLILPSSFCLLTFFRLLPFDRQLVYSAAVPGTDNNPSADAKPYRRRLRILVILLLRLAGLALAVWTLKYGLRMRDDLWTWSSPIRFVGDIRNALRQGSAVVSDGVDLATAEGVTVYNATLPTKYLLRGFLHRYDTVVSETTDGQYNLDYTPARLLVMSFWARYVLRVDPIEWRFAARDALPLLKFNTACDIAAAVFMFLLVRHWVRRGGRAGPEWAWLLGLVAALISWFNPSTLVDAHMWPQWDVWIVPFYLAAMYLASVEWWFAAGISLAIGAMFKGQMMMVAPVMLLWPLLGGRWSAAIRIVIGFLFATALMASPWLAENPHSWPWIGGVLVLSLLFVLAGRFRRKGARREYWPIWSIVPIFVFIARPCGLSNPLAVALGLGVAATPWLARWITLRGSAVWLAAIATACLAVAAATYGGSWSWLIVGFEYPTHHYMNMNNGNSSNLCALLGQRYGWQVDDLVGHLHGWNITLKTLLVTIYACTLFLCGLGAALHDRRNDPRTLIALTAPWVLMFTLLPQMHERYLMWAAAVCGVAVASSLGMTLMHWVVIAVWSTAISTDMLSSNPSFLPDTYRAMDATHPDIGWMVLLAAAVYLFVALVPARRRRRQMKMPAPNGIAPIDFKPDRSYAGDHANQASEAVGPAGTVPADSK